SPPRVPAGPRSARLRLQLACLLREVLDPTPRRSGGPPPSRQEERKQAMTLNAKRAIVRLERTISAPPHSVYRAWLEPDLVRRWMASAGDHDRATATGTSEREEAGGQARCVR